MHQLGPVRSLPAVALNLSFASMNGHRTEGALERFEQRTAWPMMAVVLASLALLLVPVFVTLPAGAAATTVVLEWALWLVFVAEFSWRWYIAIDRAGRSGCA